MSIRRAPRPDSRFYTLNKDISEDGRLSWGARGLLIFLLGKPDNWEVSVGHLIKQTEKAAGKRSGRDAVRVILAELERVGYLTADKARVGGRFDGMAYTVSEFANPPETDYPAPDSPETGFPAPANPLLTNTDDLTRTDKDIGDIAERQPQHAACSSSSSSSATGTSSAAVAAATSNSPISHESLSGAEPAVGNPAKKAGKAKATKGPVLDVCMFSLPSWLIPERIQNFINNRHELKKPMTARAVELLIKELEVLRNAGHDPHQALDTAILKGWMSVYAPSEHLKRPGIPKFNPRDLAGGSGSNSNVKDDSFIAGYAVRLD